MKTEINDTQFANIIRNRFLDIDEGDEMVRIFNENFAQEGETMVYLGDSMFELEILTSPE